jgi:hypothetical protein
VVGAIRVGLLFVAGCAVWSLWLASPSHSQQTYTHRIADFSMFGCRNKADLALILLVPGERDSAWAQRVWAFSPSARKCTRFRKGDEVLIDQHLPGIYLARLANDPEAFWFPEEFIDKRLK